MIEIFWASLALATLALGTALTMLLLSVRENIKKEGACLDSLNKELPGILNASRLAVEDAEGILSFGRSLRKYSALAGGIFKIFDLFKSHSKETSHERA